jgi:replicative DNA helicase
MNTQNTEAEMSLIGACFLSDRVFVEFTQSVQAWQFHRPAHRTIWTAMQRLARKNQTIDVVLLENELGAGIADIGGPDYLVQLASYSPGPSRASEYAGIVRDLAEVRSYQSSARALLEKIGDEDATAADIRARVTNLQTLAINYENPFVAWADIDISRQETGVSTGYKHLDRCTHMGGYPAGQTTIVSAYHKGGKSTFLLSSFVHLATAGRRVVYATFADLNAARLKRRALRNRTGWGTAPSQNFELAHIFEDELKLQNKFWKAGVYDASRLDSGDDVETFSTWLESIHSHMPIDAAFVDYAQKITSRDKKATSDTSEQNIVSAKLSKLAERTGIALVVGSQITESNPKEGRRAMTKGSRKWEEDAGLVLRLKREDKGLYTCEVAFNRFGPQAPDAPELNFAWNAERLRFDEA